MAQKTSGEILKNLIAAFNSHNVDKLLAHMTQDIEFWDVSLQEPIRNKTELKKYLQEYFDAFPDVRWDLRNVIDNGQYACGEWVMTGTQEGELLGMKPTGKHVELRGVEIIKVVDEKVKDERAYFDSATLQKQLGA